MPYVGKFELAHKDLRESGENKGRASAVETFLRNNSSKGKKGQRSRFISKVGEN